MEPVLSAQDEVKEAIKQDILDKKIASIKKLLPSGFADDAESESNDRLEKIIASSAIDLVQLENEQATNEKILSLQAQLDDLRGGAKDTKKALNAKIKYCVFLLEQRGAR